MPTAPREATAGTARGLDGDGTILARGTCVRRQVFRSPQWESCTIRVLTKCSEPDQSRGSQFTLRQHTGMALRKPGMIFDGNENPDERITT